MIIKKLFFTYGLIIFTALTSSCDLFTNEGREVCGNISVARQIEDVTMSINDEPLLIDVLAPPAVFTHSMNRSLFIRAFDGVGKSIVDVEVLVNQQTGNTQILKLEPKGIGIDTVLVEATDSCGEMDFFVSTESTVTVTN